MEQMTNPAGCMVVQACKEVELCMYAGTLEPIQWVRLLLWMVCRLLRDMEMVWDGDGVLMGGRANETS